MSLVTTRKFLVIRTRAFLEKKFYGKKLYLLVSLTRSLIAKESENALLLNVLIDTES